MRNTALLVISLLILSGCTALPLTLSSHPAITVTYVQHTRSQARETASVAVFPGHGKTRYTQLAYGPNGSDPALGLINAQYTDRAGNGYLRDLVAQFECDFSNPARTFSPGSLYVQLAWLRRDPRGEGFAEWVKTDFVVRGVCERSRTATRDKQAAR